MIASDRRYILQVLKESLIGIKNETKVENEDKIPSMIMKNGILLTCYKNLSLTLKSKLSKQYASALKQSIVQDYEGKRILKALSDAGFDCIALKGWELRKLYPDLTMRQMADLDILVRPYNYKSIKTVMENLGFSGGSESSWMHDSFIKNEVHVEMHKRLTDDSGLIQTWEKKMWDRAVIVEGGICRMALEDYYIFHFIHLHKDFLNGSLGLRRIVDTWLLQKQSVDMEIVEAELEKFGIWLFHERMVKLSHVAMGEKEIDEASELLLNHAFIHGIYGSDKSYKAGRIATMGGCLKVGKMKSWFAAVFLPYGRMKAQFPILEKWPVLLPVYWARRIGRFLKGNLKRNWRMLGYDNVRQEDFDEMKAFLKAGDAV